MDCLWAVVAQLEGSALRQGVIPNDRVFTSGRRDLARTNCWVGEILRSG